jgi:hypothetical protein
VQRLVKNLWFFNPCLPRYAQAGREEKEKKKIFNNPFGALFAFP